MTCSRVALVKRFELHGLTARVEALSIFDSEFKHARPPYEALDDFINDLLDVFTLKMTISAAIINEELAQTAVDELRRYRRDDKSAVNEENRNAIVFRNVTVEEGDHSASQKVSSQFNHQYNQLVKGLKKLPVFESGQFCLTTVDELNTYISPVPLKAIVLGLLRKDISKIGSYLLEDPTGKLPIHFYVKDGETAWREWATFDNGIYLVEGFYNGEDDVFVVNSIGLAPPKPFLRSIQDEPMEVSNSSMCVVVNDIHLDNASSFEGLKFLFNGFNHTDQVPEVFVLIGDFLSTYTDRSELKNYMTKLVRLIGSFPRIANHSRFVFVPGPNDLEHPNSNHFAQKPFTEEHFPTYTDKLKSYHLASNPFYLQTDGKTVCFVASNFVEQSRKSVIQSALFDIHDSSVQSKSALTKKSHVDSFMKSVGRLLVSNGHLMAGVNRTFANSLSLLPTIPDAILLADAQFDQFKQETIYEQVQFTTSLSFTKNDLQFLCYYVQDNHFEESQVSI